MNEIIPCFGELDFRFARLAGDILVTVQHRLCPERRMAAHFDNDVHPLRIENMEMIMVDVRPRLFLAILPEPDRHLHIPDQSWRAGHENKKQTIPGFVRGQIFLGNLVLPIAWGTVLDWNMVVFRPSPKPTAEPAGDRPAGFRSITELASHRNHPTASVVPLYRKLSYISYIYMT